MASVLLIGTYRQTLTVIRSLARAGYRVILGVHGDAAACDRSRYVTETWNHPNINSDRERFFAELTSLLKSRDDIVAIFPIGESDITLFFDKYSEISARVKLLMCTPEVVATCLNKPMMSEIINELRIPQSQYATASDIRSLYSAGDNIGYPCIVKLADSEFLLNGKKAVICNDAAALRHDFKQWPVQGKTLIVQSFVPGVRLNLYFYALHGHIVSLGQVLALRTDRLDGTGLSVSGRSVPHDPELVDYCRKMVEKLNYTGPGCMQFQVDKSGGTTTFLEHNPRLGAGCVLPYLAGLNLPRLVLECALNEDAAAAEPPYPSKTGVQYAWINGDIAGLKRAIDSSEVDMRLTASWLFSLLKTNLTTTHHMSWSWRDPLPSVILLGRLFKSAFKSFLPGIKN